MKFTVEENKVSLSITENMAVEMFDLDKEMTSAQLKDLSQNLAKYADAAVELEQVMAKFLPGKKVRKQRKKVEKPAVEDKPAVMEKKLPEPIVVEDHFMAGVDE